MTILAITLLVCAVIGAFMMFTDSDTAFVIGLIFVIGGMVGFFLAIRQDEIRQKKAYHSHVIHDLKAQGWHVKSSDVHWLDDQVYISCVPLSVKKLAGIYFVVSKRPDYIGGGYKFISPTKEQAIRKVCP